MDNEILPPHDIDAEEATLGSLLIDGVAVDNVPFLNVNDFYDERNSIIYHACMELKNRHEAIDLITVSSELNRQGKLDEIGGSAFLSYLVSVVPTSIDLVHYANIVQRNSIFRKLINAGQQITKKGYSLGIDPTQALNEADELLLEIRKNTVGTPIISPEQRLELLEQRYTDLYKKEQTIAIKTGISSLDMVLGGGLFKGEFILLAARPGMGKTAFAQTIANNVGRTGRNVLYCSVEMTWQSLSDRDIAGIVNKPIGAIRQGAYTEELYDKIIVDGLSKLSELSVYYYDDQPMTTAKVLNAGMEMILRHGLSFIVVDYLGILGDEYGRSPYERVGYISRKIKQVSRILDIPVLALHQLSRGLEQQNDKRPQLHDLRDSGNLEEDADVVLFLYRDNYYYDNVDGMTELILGKQRQGDSGGKNKVPLYFNETTKRYTGIYDGENE